MVIFRLGKLISCRFDEKTTMKLSQYFIRAAKGKLNKTYTPAIPAQESENIYIFECPAAWVERHRAHKIHKWMFI